VSLTRAVADEAESQLLIIVPGYRPARIYLAQIGRTTALRPR
jgi:hypothetical protein